MAQFITTRVRCPLFPNKVNQAFNNLFTGGTPQIYKGAGCDFEFGLFNTENELFDVSDLVDLTILVRPQGGGATEILKTVNGPFQNIAQDAWDNGSAAHGIVALLGTETLIAAGTHEITIWGHTSDNAADPDVFGTSKLQVVDAGITAVTNPALNPQYLTADQVTALLKGYLPAILPPGLKITFTSEDSAWRRVLGIGSGVDGAVMIDDIEANTAP